MPIHGFGYTSHYDVKHQFDTCMLNGELDSICKIICLLDSPDGHGRGNHGNDDEGILETKCDECNDLMQRLEEDCLIKLYSHDFFWNWFFYINATVK